MAIRGLHGGVLIPLLSYGWEIPMLREYMRVKAVEMGGFPAKRVCSPKIRGESVKGWV